MKMTDSKNRKYNKKNKLIPSDHHIIPTSRGGSSELENIARTNKRDHQFYHALFENRIPEEIVENLVNKYWNGNWDYVRDAYNSNNK